MTDNRYDSLSARPRMRDSPSMKWGIIAFIATMSLIFGVTFIGVTDKRAATASDMISPWGRPTAPGAPAPGPTSISPAPHR